MAERPIATAPERLIAVIDGLRAGFTKIPLYSLVFHCRKVGGELRRLLEQVHDAWARSVLPAVMERSIPVASLLTEAKPTHLGEDTLTLEFPAGADFHRRQVAEPQNIGLRSVPSPIRVRNRATPRVSSHRPPAACSPR